MAVVFLDGLETLGVSGGNPVDVVFSRRYVSSDPNDIRVVTGKYSRRGFSLLDTNSYFTLYAGSAGSSYATDTTKIWGTSLRAPTEVFPTYPAMAWYSDTGSLACSIDTYADGSIDLLDRTNTSIAVSQPNVFRPYCWNRIEAKVYYHATAGTFELWVNGKQVLNETNIDTSASTGTYHTECRMFCASGATVKAQQYDDLYVIDTTGSTHNDFLGPSTCVARFPTGDDTSQWTPSTAGTHYNLVDEDEPDDDTSYVEDGATGNIDLYTTTNLSGISDVYAVAIGTDYRLDSVGTQNFRQIIESGGTQYNGATVNATSTTYDYTDDVWNEDPDTGSAWTLNGYNATKPGVEVVA